MNEMKDKKHMIVSINADIAFVKIQHLFMIKTLGKVGIEGVFLNTVKPHMANLPPTLYSTGKN